MQHHQVDPLLEAHFYTLVTVMLDAVQAANHCVNFYVISTSNTAFLCNGQRHNRCNLETLFWTVPGSNLGSSGLP
jgi:hypothetical protein